MRKRGRPKTVDKPIREANRFSVGGIHQHQLGELRPCCPTGIYDADSWDEATPLGAYVLSYAEQDPSADGVRELRDQILSVSYGSGKKGWNVAKKIEGAINSVLAGRHADDDDLATVAAGLNDAGYTLRECYRLLWPERTVRVRQ